MAISLGARKGLAPKSASRARRQLRARKKINGSATRPRLVVTRSTRHLFVQVIDDVFDRAGNKYHGRIAALADAAREAGLDF